MRKLLTATTALALVGGAAFAEVGITGAAKFGVDYDSSMEDVDESKHRFRHEIGVDFSMSGTTDGGLSFGASTGINGHDSNDVDEGTVYVSGAFGKLTIGDNDSADKLAGGISDVGLFGIGVDDVAESLHGATENEIRYDHSFGDIAIAASAGIDDGDNEYAAGMKFTASGVSVGLGFDSNDAVSLGVGYSINGITANAFYSQIDEFDVLGEVQGEYTDFAGSVFEFDAITAEADSLGVDVSYTIGASTITLVYAKVNNASLVNKFTFDPDDLVATHPLNTSEDDDPVEYTVTINAEARASYGLQVSHDLGGGATLIAGFGQVPNLDEVTHTTTAVDEGNNSGSVTSSFGDKNKASVGLSFSF